MSITWFHPVYCDHCGEPTKPGELVVYSVLPFDTDSANKGESGVLCHNCDEALHNKE